MLLAGCLAGSLHPASTAPDLDADPGETVLLSGCIAGPVAADGIQSRFPLELEPGARARITLTAREGEHLPSLHYGDRIEIETRVRKPHNFGNPSAFDYVGYLRRDSVYWLASARGIDRIHLLPGTCGSPWRRAALNLRDLISSRISELYRNDEYARRLMPALLVGDNSELDRSWTSDFRRTGTYHAIVISGLHITVVAGAALFLMRLLGVPFGLMLASACALAWVYAAVADWQAPVVRSAVGFTLFLIARWFFRQGRLLNLLGLTAVVLLAFDPGSLFDPSFQLTFLSIAAIGGLASQVIDRLFGGCQHALHDLAEPKIDVHSDPRAAQFRIDMRLLVETFILATGLPSRIGFVLLTAGLKAFFWVGEMAIVSTSVQLVLLVPMVAYFHQVSITAVLANLAVVPALSAAVPIGLLAAVTNSHALAACASFLLWIGRISTSFWASVEPASRVPDGPLWVSGALLLSAAVFGALLVLQARKLPVLCSGGVAVLLAFALVAAPFPPDLQTGSLELTAIDVGQGDSLLVVFPDKRTMLMDGGGFPVFDHRLRPRLDIGEDVVSPYLWRRGLRHLDIVAVTHLHDDHAAGLPAVIRNFHPAEVWTGAAPAHSELLTAIQSAAKEAGSRIIPGHEGLKRDFGGASLSVLSPSPDYLPGRAARNDDSLVILLGWGRHKFLLTGDAERTTESTLVSRGLLPEIDVLKAGHHGSRTSTTPPFLEAVRPLFALISVGEGNSYGHPYPDVINRLNEMGTRILRTDNSGLVQVRSDGRRLTVSRFSDGPQASAPAVFDKSF